MPTLIPQKLNASVFKPYGDVIEIEDHDHVVINSGNCLRYTDLAKLDIDPSGQHGISLFDAKAYSSPVEVKYVERHPLGSQAFLPTSRSPYLVVVAEDRNGKPCNPESFITSGYQGVNYHRNTWHGVLTPLQEQGLFVVVDYIGDEDNLEEHWFEEPLSVHCQ